MIKTPTQTRNPHLKPKICERLKRARMEAGFETAKEFAEKNNLKISTYTLHEAGTRNMSIEVTEFYSQLLNINVEWLLTGIGPKNRTHVRNVPIIDWNEIALFPKEINLDNKKRISSDVDLSPDSFALLVDNDSMEPRYPEGTIIIVDCQQKPMNKDFALILFRDKNLAIFKQIVQVDGELYAKALNPDYKPFQLNKNSHIVGKVVQAKLIF